MPRSSEPPQSPNRLLASLAPKDYKRLRARLELVSYPLSEVLFRAKDPVRYLYFPEGAVVSLITVMQHGENVEVSLVGREGIAGVEALLGAKTHGHDGVIQYPGNCLRIKVGVLKSVLHRDGLLLKESLAYVHDLLLQVSQTAACNRVHKLQERLARWLLMTHDRVENAVFPATHEFLSTMLGTHRSDVTVAAGVLRRAGHMAYARGIVTILSRKGMESAACECYAAVQRRSSQLE